MQRRTALRAFGGACVLGTVGCASFGGETEDRPATDLRGAWSQKHGNARNTPFVARSLDSDGVAKRWETRITDEWIGTQPVVDGSRVFVGTATGTVRAFEARTGDAIWQETTAGVQGTPAFGDGSLVVPVDDGTVVGFDVTTGDRRWSTELPAPVVDSISLADEIAFVTTRDGTVEAINVTNGNRRWRTQLDGRTRGKPAVSGGRVLLATAHSGAASAGRAVALDAVSGDRLWTVETEKRVRGPVRFSDGVAYVAGAWDNAIDVGTEIRRGTVFGLDGETGEVVDALGVSSGHISVARCGVETFAVVSERSYVASCNAVMAYGTSGEQVWDVPIPGGVASPFVVSANGILFGDFEGRLRWLDAGTGQSPVVGRLPGLAPKPTVLERGLVVASDEAVAVFE